MKHLEFWIQILTLIVGTGLLAHTYQLRRQYGLPALKHIWVCLLFLNLGFLANAVSKYVLVSIFADLILFKGSFYAEVIDPLGTVFYVGLVYYLVLLFRTLLDRREINVFRWLFGGFAAVVVLRTVFGLVAGRPTTMYEVFNAAHIIIMIFVTGIYIVASLHFIAVSLHLPDRDRSRSLTLLGLFYLAGWAVLLLSAMFSREYHGLLSQIVFLTFNIFPFVWYRSYVRSSVPVAAQINSVVDIDSSCAKQGISTRERQIIELVLRGKSNKAIADELFIAPHTVKNHLYSIYQKMKVKSRYELIGLFVNTGKQ